MLALLAATSICTGQDIFIQHGTCISAIYNRDHITVAADRKLNGIHKKGSKVVTEAMGSLTKIHEVDGVYCCWAGIDNAKTTDGDLHFSPLELAQNARRSSSNFHEMMVKFTQSASQPLCDVYAVARRVKPSMLNGHELEFSALFFGCFNGHIEVYRVEGKPSVENGKAQASLQLIPSTVTESNGVAMVSMGFADEIGAYQAKHTLTGMNDYKNWGPLMQKYVRLAAAAHPDAVGREMDVLDLDAGGGRWKRITD